MMGGGKSAAKRRPLLTRTAASATLRITSLRTSPLGEVLASRPGHDLRRQSSDAPTSRRCSVVLLGSETLTRSEYLGLSPASMAELLHEEFRGCGDGRSPEADGLELDDPSDWSPLVA